MKHRVRIHGKKPKEKAARRQPKVVRKALTISDMVKAVRHRAWPTVMQALADGVHPDGVNIHGDPLIMAVAAIAPTRVVEAVLKAGADPDAINRKGETALFYTTDPRVTELLCAKGANVHHRSKGGQTALHVLADAGQTQALKAMIAAGANVNERDDAGRTPLVRAILQLRLAAVEELLALQADVKVLTKEGHTQLHVAAAQRSKSAVTIVELLLRAGADPNARTPDELTPLMLVATPEATERLLAAGADVNAMTSQHATALAYAVLRDEPVIARLLLNAKADAKIRIAADHPNQQLAGKTAREIGLESASSEVRRLFK